jgi:hypothetical protein
MHKISWLKLVLIIVFVTGTIRDTHAQHANRFTIIIDANDKAQTIQNIGASGCWYSEGIGKYWPLNKKERIAQLLFSRKLDNAGNPTGIGLSAFRFNIGGGTAE